MRHHKQKDEGSRPDTRRSNSLQLNSDPVEDDTVVIVIKRHRRRSKRPDTRGPCDRWQYFLPFLTAVLAIVSDVIVVIILEYLELN